MTERTSETTTAELISPLENTAVTDVFGQRVNPVTGRAEEHKGIDLSAKLDTPVVACADGIVESCGTANGYGNFLKVKGENYTYLYGHLNELKVQKNEKVRQGQIVALSGDTGQATGPHLHFELYKGDELTDPIFIFGSNDNADR